MPPGVAQSRTPPGAPTATSNATFFREQVLAAVPFEGAAERDAGEARTATSAGARETEKERGAENPSLQLAPGAPPRRYQTTRLRLPGSKEVVLRLAVPSAESGAGGPRATPLSPKTTTPEAGPPPLLPGSRTLAESVTGEHAVAAPLGGSAFKVTEHD